MTRLHPKGLALLPALLAALIALWLPTSASAAACPGSPDPCPWTGTPAVFGDVAPGSIRGANDIAYHPGSDVVWVLDTSRNQVRKYTASTGAFVSAFGSEGFGNQNLNNPQGIAVDSPGNVYVADGNNNIVKKFNSSGVWQLNFGTGTQGSGDGQLKLPDDVAVDSLGFVYVADTGNSRIQKFSSTGSFVAKWGSGGTGDGQFSQHDFGGGFVLGLGPTGLAIDSFDKVYAVDMGNSRIQKFDSAGAFLAKTGTNGSAPGQFQSPDKIAVLNNLMYVTETARLTRLDAQTATFGASPTVVAANGSATGEVAGLTGVAAGTGGLFTVEANSNFFGNNRVQHFDETTNAFIKQFALDAPGQLLRPEGVASDPGGNVYVADTQKDRVVKFDSNGVFVWAVGSSGTAPGQFDGPVGIASDGTHVWVGDAGNHRLQRIDASDGGNPQVLGTQGPNPGEFDYPAGIAVDSNGDLYVADTGQDRVQKFTASSSTWSVLHGTGTGGLGTDELEGPRGVAVQGASLWIADTSNNRIKKVSKTTGAVELTIGAAGGSTGTANGEFGFPRGIAATADYVYVTDQNSDRVQRFSSGGAFLGKWGEFGDALGELNSPYGISAQGGATDSVYVVEWGNERVQRFSVGAPPSDTTAPVVNLANPVDNSFTKSRQPAIDGTAGFESTDNDLQFELNRQKSDGTYEHVPNEGPIVNGFWTVPKPTGSANFSTTVPISLPDGVYHLRAYQSDQAGNPNPQDPRSSRLFTVDNVAPVVELANPVDNSKTTSTRPAISGTAGNAASDNDLRFELNRQKSDGTFEPYDLNGGTFVSGDNNWTFPKPTSGNSFSTTIPVDLPVGTYHLRAYQSDKAGNDNPQDTRTSRLFTVEVIADTTAPKGVTITSPAKDAVLGDPRPTFAGTAGTAEGDSQTINVDLEQERSGGGFAPIEGTTATRSGGTWSVKLPRDLAPGRYYVHARQADAAKNEGSSEFVLFTIAGKPVNVGNPQMSGPEAAIGVKLSGGSGTWTGGGNLKLFGVWMRCPDTVVEHCKGIDGSGGAFPTGSTYEITRADVGQRLLWAVLASNEAGFTVAYASHFTGVVTAPLVDSDGDGLSDFEETGPIDWTGDGVIDIDLSEFGADPRHKDLFVEVDNMKSRQLRQDGVAIAVQTLARAPLTNPDGKNGITLHVDNGADSIMDPRTGEKWGSRSKSDLIDDKPVIVTGGNWDDFDKIKLDQGKLTPARQTTFRYVINGFRHTASTEGSSGKARAPESDFRGSDMVVTLAGVQCDPGVTGCGDTETAHAGTLLHEFGHLIGLRHGGGDNVPNKPNYLSVMNYDFQFFGLRTRVTKTNVFDYSRWGASGKNFVAEIDENSLDETAGLKAGGTADDYTTLTRCWKTDGSQVITRTAFNVAIDFSCNGSKFDSKLPAGKYTVNPDGAVGVLRPFDDWANIRFEGGWVDSFLRASSNYSAGTVSRRERGRAKAAQTGVARQLPDLPDHVALKEPPASKILEATRVLAGDAIKPIVTVKIKGRTLIAAARDNKALDQLRVTVGKKSYVRLAKTNRSKRAKLKVRLENGKRRIVAVAIDRASNGAAVKLKRRIK